MTNSLEADKAKAAKMFINFSKVLKKDIYDADGIYLGGVWDVSVKFGEVYPRLDELIIKSGFFKLSYAAVQWPRIAAFEDGIVLDIKKDALPFSPAPKEYEFLLRRDVLDQQVVDTYNHKVIRVNDIHLLKVDHEIMVAHVDIGLKGLLRRLGWEWLFSKFLKTDDLVSWKYVQPVSINPASMTMKLSVSQKQLSGIPAADLTEIMFDLNTNERMALFRALDIKTKAKIFEAMEFEEQKMVLKELDKNQAVQIITNMSSRSEEH